MASGTYTPALQAFQNGNIDWENDDIRCLLLQDGGSENLDHATIAAVLAASTEISVSGYARQTVTTVAATLDTVNDKSVRDANDVTFPSLGSGQTVGKAVLYKHVTNDSDSIPIDLIDGTPVATDGNNMVVEFHADGVAEIGQPA